MDIVEAPRTPTRRSPGALIGGVLILLVGAGSAFWGITTRTRASAEVARETRESSVPIVTVISPARGATEDEIVLPGTMQAFADAPIYARVNGYLKRWTADIGTRVRAGQLLAEIETPETDQQLLQAQADLATAEANAKLAQSTAARYRDLIQTDSVSRLDLDNANGNADAKQAEVESARANVKRLQQLQSFSRVEAPFAGVVTARNVDVGALIGSNNKELFHVAATDRLRVFVNVPQIYSRAAVTGLQASLTLKEFPGRSFTGRLARSSQSIDVASRTMLVEVDVDNSRNELLPGSYAGVHLKLPTPAATFKLPVTAVMFDAEGVRVAKVVGGRVSLVPVTLGRDFGNTVEVVEGVSAEDQIVSTPSDSLTNGIVVRTSRPE